MGRRKNLTPTEKKTILNLFIEYGGNRQRIGDEMEISRDMVNRVIRNAGISEGTGKWERKMKPPKKVEKLPIFDINKLPSNTSTFPSVFKKSAIEMLQSGFSCSEVAKEFGVSKSDVITLKWSIETSCSKNSA